MSPADQRGLWEMGTDGPADVSVAALRGAVTNAQTTLLDRASALYEYVQDLFGGKVTDADSTWCLNQVGGIQEECEVELGKLQSKPCSVEEQDTFQEKLELAKEFCSKIRAFLGGGAFS
jgi:hypothetical protein